MQKLKELIKLTNLCNFQLFVSSIEGNIRHQKLRNCLVAKKLMSGTSLVKFRVSRVEFLRNLQRKVKRLCPFNIQSFYFISVITSDKHMLMKCKDSPIQTGKELPKINDCTLTFSLPRQNFPFPVKLLWQMQNPIKHFACS